MLQRRLPKAKSRFQKMKRVGINLRRYGRSFVRPLVHLQHLEGDGVQHFKVSPEMMSELETTFKLLCPTKTTEGVIKAPELFNGLESLGDTSKHDPPPRPPPPPR